MQWNRMQWKATAMAVALAAATVAVPLSSAQAYWRRGPIFWPFAAGAAIVGTAAAIATLPLRAVAGPYPYPPAYYYPPAPYYYAPRYSYGPAPYGPGY